MKTVALTAAALVAFAANSLLCRLALGPRLIDPISFTTIRLVSGALVLALIAAASARGTARGGSWGSAWWLVIYAVPFSLAYLSLTAGTGALILFGSVQLTMTGTAIVKGARPRAAQVAGLLVALVGLVALLWPGLTAPSPGGAALMAVAGVAWGAYSLRGRTAPDPLAENAGNFARALPIAVAISAIAFASVGIGGRGALYAVISGAVTSGGGYVVWYAALARLSAFRASVVQLAVPVLAATGGVLLLGEAVSGRLIGAAALVVGGIGLALVNPARGA